MASMSMLQRRMISEEDEGNEVEVRREDQDRINRFSRLHQRELGLEEQLKVKSKEKEDLDDLSTELELADEDDKIPYRIGDAFFHVPLEQAQKMLAVASAKVDEEMEDLESKMGALREEMGQLKIELYARFGKQINLET